jgi:signal transduction histidine kinase
MRRFLFFNLVLSILIAVSSNLFAEKYEEVMQKSRKIMQQQEIDSTDFVYLINKYMPVLVKRHPDSLNVVYSELKELSRKPGVPEVPVLLDVQMSEIQLQRGRDDSVRSYLLKAQSRVIEDNLSSVESLVLQRIGTYYGLMDKLDSCEYFFQKGLESALNSGINYDIGYAYNGLGNVGRFKGNFFIALDYYKKAREAFSKVKSHPECYLTGTYNYAGLLYSTFKYEEAMRVYSEGLDFAIEKNMAFAQTEFYSGLAMTYSALDSIDKSISVLEKAIELAAMFENLRQQAFDRVSLAMNYSKIGDYEKAKNQINLAMPILEKYNDDRSIWDARVILAEVALYENDLKQAKKIANELYLQIEDEEHFTNIQNVTELLSKIHEREGDYFRALNYFKESSEVKDSIYSNSLVEQLTRHSMERNFERERLENRLREQELIKDAEIKTIVMWASFAFALGIVIFAVYLIYTIRKIRRQNQLLEKKNKKIEEQRNRINRQHEQLIVYKDHLEDVVAERTHELKKAKVKAEESDKLKSEFLANITHEVRTPLNVIVNAGKMIAEFDNLPKEEKMTLSVMLKDNSERLTETIEDISMLANIKSGNPNLALLSVTLNDISESLETSIKDFSATKPGLESGIQISQELLDISFETNPEHLSKALRCLISNAFKFTHKGSVTVGAEVTTGHNLRFYVKDTGIGIEENKRAEIFRPFFQQDGSMNRAYEGSGTGLALFSEIIELLGGTKYFDSEVGVGSTFYCEFPLPTD